MRIKTVAIRNFRSIRELEFQCHPLTILIGKNNHGKSNILHALDYFFDTGWPVKRSDFFLGTQPGDGIVVEITFSELTEQDNHTFKDYLRADSTIVVRKVAHLSGEDKVDTEYEGQKVEPKAPWLKKSNATEYAKREKVDELKQEGVDVDKYFPSSGRILKQMVLDFQKQFIEEHLGELEFEEPTYQGPFLGVKSVPASVMADYYLIPAVRDLSEETRIQSKTYLGKLLGRAVAEMAQNGGQLADLKQRLSEIVASLNRGGLTGATSETTQLRDLENNIKDELLDWGVTDVDIEVMPPDLDKIFQMGTTLNINDGVRTEASAKGHGLQRAVIFAMTKAWAAAIRSEKLSRREHLGEEECYTSRAPTGSVFIAFEEPELFVHPQAQRTYKDAIRQLAEASDHQVFVSTHSSFFLDLDDYQSICIVAKPSVEDGTTLRQVTGDVFSGTGRDIQKAEFKAAYFLNPDRSELFFADKVLLVEGQTEKVIIAAMARSLRIFKHSVSVIDCGCKHNIPLYIRVLEAFRIPYFVMHDEDPITADKSDPKHEGQQRTFNLNTEIAGLMQRTQGQAFIAKPDIEGFLGISTSAGDTWSKPLAAYKHVTSGSFVIPKELENWIQQVYG